jgi:hypothetical protein
MADEPSGPNWTQPLTIRLKKILICNLNVTETNCGITKVILLFEMPLENVGVENIAIPAESEIKWKKYKLIKVSSSAQKCVNNKSNS